MKTPVTAEVVRTLLEYDATTGVLRWKRDASARAKAGTVAGCSTKRGYRVINIYGQQYKEHRVVWLHHYGEWPSEQIDHINGNKADNRISNLRDVDQSINRLNLHGAMKNSVVTGLLGAYETRPGRYQARIQVNGRRVHLGMHDTPEAAHAAYIAFKSNLPQMP